MVSSREKHDSGIAESPPNKMPSTTPYINITDSYPLELHYVKALFLQKHYRQCISSCRELLQSDHEAALDRPLRQSFLNFYLALAHDELARLMHDYSQAKIPAFTQAEQFYRSALASLPSASTDFQLATAQHSDPFFTAAAASTRSHALPQHLHTSSRDSYYTCNQPESPPDYRRSMSMPTRSSTPNNQVPASRETSTSDLESHSSFDQIMTPHKVLQRDASRMSLLDHTAQRDPSRTSLLDDLKRPGPVQRSTSQGGLLRQIRPGDAPGRYHVPPKLPYSASARGQLPRLVTDPRTSRSAAEKRWTGSTVSSQNFFDEEEEEEEEEDEVSPVSPLNYGDVTSDVSTISPISPATPIHNRFTSSPASPTSVDDHLQEQLEAMQVQLESHLTLLTHAKLGTQRQQAARAALRTVPPTSGTPLTPLSKPSEQAKLRVHEPKRSTRPSLLHTPGNGSWASPSSPADQKIADLQRRIREGRARGWKRERFDARRYKELAERALSEL